MRRRTQSSVWLEFAESKINYDLVPMLAVQGTDEEQILLRAGGERRRTSIQKHIEFVKTRTRKSNDLPGRVKFKRVRPPSSSGGASTARARAICSGPCRLS